MLNNITIELINQNSMEKVIKNGKVAVLISHGYGAGWYSWNTEYEQLLFHPKLVEMVEQDRNSEITDEWVKENLGINIYTGGVDGLTIHWLPEGMAFTVEEYDGAESIRTIEDLVLIA
jgi:hypothetical protein